MKQNIALALSGGAARGLAHIGVILELEKKYTITSMAGNSMGALVGAIYAAGNLNEFVEWLEHIERKDIFRLFDPTLSRQGFIKGEKLFKKLEAFIPDINIEDLPIPFVIVAADITNEKEVVFSTGSLKQAVRASIAIPAILKPVIINGAMMVDGGAVNPIPLNRVARQEGDILVGSFVNAMTEPLLLDDDTADDKTKKRSSLKNWNSSSYFKIMSSTSGLLTYSLSMMKIEKYKPDLLINISRDSCRNFQFHRFREMIKIGQRVTQKTLKELK